MPTFRMGGIEDDEGLWRLLHPDGREEFVGPLSDEEKIAYPQLVIFDELALVYGALCENGCDPDFDELKRWYVDRWTQLHRC